MATWPAQIAASPILSWSSQNAHNRVNMSSWLVKTTKLKSNTRLSLSCLVSGRREIEGVKMVGPTTFLGLSKLERNERYLVLIFFFFRFLVLLLRVLHNQKLLRDCQKCVKKWINVFLFFLFSLVLWRFSVVINALKTTRN